MSRVITFSMKFPKGHPKEGQPTFFVEKLLLSIYKDDLPRIHELDSINEKEKQFIMSHKAKHHTIRAGNRWKVGDKFSPRVWLGKPYNSPQITIAPDIEIKQVWEIKISSMLSEKGEKLFQTSINGVFVSTKAQYAYLAANDGLGETDLLDWFWSPKKPFQGQIICWNETVKY